MAQSMLVQAEEAIVVGRTLDEFEVLIKRDLSMVKEGLLLAGQHLLAARAEHPRSFVRWLDSGVAGMSRSSAYRLMDLARSDLAKFPTLGNFPAESGALGELAKLPASELQHALDTGAIHPAMHRKDARALVASYEADPAVAGPASAGASSPQSGSSETAGRKDRAVGSSPTATSDFAFRLTFNEAKVLLRCLTFVKVAATRQRLLGHEEEYAALLSLKVRVEELLGVPISLSEAS